MTRIRRKEELMQPTGMRVIGFSGEDGSTLNDVEDRFNTPVQLEDPDTGRLQWGDTLAGNGIRDLTLAEVIALGFTTIEYQWMLRYELESPKGSFIRNEFELNALVAGHEPSKTNGIRLAYQHAPEGSVTRAQFERGTNHRQRGVDQNWPHHALGWVDEQGNRVQHVPDRFKARYLYDGYFGGRQIMEPLSEKGVTVMELTSLVVLGFSADEYRAIHAYEEETGSFVQSENHLDEIMGFSRDPGLKPPSR